MGRSTAAEACWTCHSPLKIRHYHLEMPKPGPDFIIKLCCVKKKKKPSLFNATHWHSLHVLLRISVLAVLLALFKNPVSIAGHRHQGWCRRHRHSTSQSGTGAFRYRTGSSYSDNGLVPASVFFFIPVLDCPNAGQSGICNYSKKEERGTPSTSIHGCCAKLTLWC